MRKVLNNPNKSKRLSGTTKGKVGTVLNLLDKNKETLCVGDFNKNMTPWVFASKYYM